ncbi:MAG: hypothetical protein E7Z87_02770 [Cyanobacteria bacterium SIG26]|nr:hypothetical protein [Cyanobacteria bacterium SIG26]
MLSRIQNTTQQLYYPTRLKRFFQSHLNSQKYTKIIPNIKQATVGSLPTEIIKAFDGKKSTNSKIFLRALADITKFLRATYLNLNGSFEYNLNKLPKDIVQNFERKASNLFTNNIKHLFPSGTTAEIKFAGKGEFGSVYQISLFDKNKKKLMHDKALKVYHSIIDKEEGWHSAHGNYAEANFWTYIKYHAGHSLSKTQLTKHYLSDMKSGYALTEFIDEDITKTTSPLNIKGLFKIRNQDIFGNKPILGKLYDVGLFFKEKNFTGDKMVLRYLKKLYYRSEKDLKPFFEGLLDQSQNPKNEHRNKIKTAIEIFKERFPEREDWLK